MKQGICSARATTCQNTTWDVGFRDPGSGKTQGSWVRCGVGVCSGSCKGHMEVRGQGSLKDQVNKSWEFGVRWGPEVGVPRKASTRVLTPLMALKKMFGS